MRHARRPIRLDVYAVVLVCTPERWDEVRQQFSGVSPGISQGREFLSRTYANRRVVLLRSGEGVVAAAAAAQFAIDRWNPRVVMRTASDEGQEAAIEEVSRINGAALLAEPLDSGDIGELMEAAFVASDEMPPSQNRTR
jgi:hypothetical protein